MFPLVWTSWAGRGDSHLWDLSCDDGDSWRPLSKWFLILQLVSLGIFKWWWKGVWKLQESTSLNKQGFIHISVCTTFAYVPLTKVKSLGQATNQCGKGPPARTNHCVPSTAKVDYSLCSNSNYLCTFHVQNVLTSSETPYEAHLTVALGSGSRNLWFLSSSNEDESISWLCLF